jgi:hypothetical protein
VSSSLPVNLKPGGRTGHRPASLRREPKARVCGLSAQLMQRCEQS